MVKHQYPKCWLNAELQLFIRQTVKTEICIKSILFSQNILKSLSSAFRALVFGHITFVTWSRGMSRRKWCKKIGIKFFRQMTHFPWSCHIWTLSWAPFSYHSESVTIQVANCPQVAYQNQRNAQYFPAGYPNTHRILVIAR